MAHGKNRFSQHWSSIDRKNIMKCGVKVKMLDEGWEWTSTPHHAVACSNCL